MVKIFHVPPNVSTTATDFSANRPFGNDISQKIDQLKNKRISLPNSNAMNFDDEKFAVIGSLRRMSGEERH